MLRLTEFLIHTLQRIAPHFGRTSHLTFGRRGETEAYFHLKRLGYRVVATNFRVPQDRGEIDLIAWDGDILCFIEVKTRSDDSFAPPSTAVTRDKQRHILSVARRYLRRLPGERRPSCRFDIVSIVSADAALPPRITLRKGAYSWDADGTRRRPHREYYDRRFWRRWR